MPSTRCSRVRILAVATAALLCVLAGPGSDAIAGGALENAHGLTVAMPPGWDRAPEEVEAEMGMALFGSEPDDLAGPLMIGISPQTLDYTDDADRRRALDRWVETLRVDGASVTVRARRVAGVDALETVSVDESDPDAITTDYRYALPRGGKIRVVFVWVPGRNAPLHPRAVEFLGALRFTADTPPTSAANAVAIPPIEIPEATDLAEFDREIWCAAVSFAVEGMRLVYGAMSPEDTERFETTWAPFYEYPLPEAVEYVNGLNPLLGQFLALRGAMAAAAGRFDTAWAEARRAASYDLEAETRLALIETHQAQQALESIRARLAENVEKVHALGDPPDLLALVDAARRRHRSALGVFAQRNPLDLAGEWVGVALSDGFEGPVKARPVHFALFVREYRNPFSEKTETTLDGVSLGGIGLPVGSPTKSYWSGGMIPGATVVPAHWQHEMVAGLDGEYLDYELPGAPPTRVIAERVDGLLPAPDERVGTAAIEAVTAAREAVLARLAALRVDRYRDDSSTPATGNGDDPGGRVEQPDEDDSGGVTPAPGAPRPPPNTRGDDPIQLNAILLALDNQAQFFANHLRWRGIFSATVDDWERHPADSLNMDTDECADAFVQRLRERIPDLPPEGEIAAGGGAAGGASAAQPKDEGPSPEEIASRDEAIAFHRSNLRIIELNLTRDRAELTKTTDPGRRKMLEFGILAKESDLIAVSDLIASLQTGRYVHTRTPFDEYARAHFIETVRTESRNLEGVMRCRANAPRLLDGLPYDLATQLRRDLDEELNPDRLARLDVDGARAVVSRVHSEVDAYWRRQKSGADAEAWRADVCLKTAQGVKLAADTSIQICSFFGGEPVQILYEGAVGYVEGGPKEAFTRAASNYNLAAATAVATFKGFEEAGKEGDLGKALAYGTWEAVRTVAVAKVMEFGAGAVSKRFAGEADDIADDVAGATSGSHTAGDAPGAAPSRPRPPPDRNAPITAEEYAEYQRLLRDGEDRVGDLRRSWRTLQQARDAGEPIETVSRLQREFSEHVHAVHESPEAKTLLKSIQSNGGDRALVENYSHSLGLTHANVEAEFNEIMTRQRGWNPQELREFRNASSAGTMGMDHDVGLKERPFWVTGPDGRQRMDPWLQKNGKPAGIHDWQKDASEAWNEAYQRITGRSPTRSWENVTTSRHTEAYRDLGWTSDLNVWQNRARLDPRWAEQAADVTSFKSWHMLNDPEISRVQALVEAARGTGKDIRTKLLPQLQNVSTGSAAATQSRDSAVQHWQEIQRIFDGMGSHAIDPITADRQIRLLTGGKSIPEVVEQMSGVMSAFSKVRTRR